MQINTFVVYSRNDITLPSNLNYVKVINEFNYGLGHKFNTGIQLALSNGFDLFTLLTDDERVHYIQKSNTSANTDFNS